MVADTIGTTTAEISIKLNGKSLTDDALAAACRGDRLQARFRLLGGARPANALKTALPTAATDELDASDGHFKFVYNNVRGFAASGWHTIKNWNADCFAITETHLSEASTRRAKQVSKELSYQLYTGAPVELTTVACRKDMGRQTYRASASGVAIGVKPPNVLIPTLSTPERDGLLRTTRWQEGAILMAKPAVPVHFGVAYGFSGASSGGHTFNENELFLIKVFARAQGHGEVPYILAIDANISRQQSPTIKAALESGWWHIAADVMKGSPSNAPTFFSNGVDSDIEEVTTGATEIDFIFLNTPAMRALTHYGLNYHDCGPDHAALQATFDFKKLDMIANKWSPPPVLPIHLLPTYTLEQQHGLLCQAAAENISSLAQSLSHFDLEAADTMWHKIAYDYLTLGLALSPQLYAKHKSNGLGQQRGAPPRFSRQPLTAAPAQVGNGLVIATTWEIGACNKLLKKTHAL